MLLVKDHASQGGIDPAWPLMEALVLSLALAEQPVSVYGQDRLRHRVHQLEGEDGHFEELSLRLLALLDPLDFRHSRVQAEASLA